MAETHAVDHSRLGYLNLMREIEDFLYMEADMIDERRYEEWFELFAHDLRYWVPLRKNVALRDRDSDIGASDDVAWVDDDKATLHMRIKQLMTGVHWSEEPLSRVSRLVTNVRLDEPRASLAEGEEVLVKSHFMVHRNRLDVETDILAGRRRDLLRRVGPSFQVVQRTVILDQNVLTSKNLAFLI